MDKIEKLICDSKKVVDRNQLYHSHRISIAIITQPQALPLIIYLSHACDGY